jgi:hypothetical protein
MDVTTFLPTIVIPVLSAILAFISAYLAYRQKNKELEQQFSSQKEQLRLLREQVEHEHLRVQADLEQIRKANLSPEERAALTVSLLPVPSIDQTLEYWPPRSPYIVGLPISDPAHYFRNKDQVKDFYGRVLGPQLNCLSILGARRSGKTSFINLLCHPQIHQQYLTPPEIRRLVTVNLNLQSGITSPALFFRYLVLKTFEAVQKHGNPNEPTVNLPTMINEQYVSSFFKELRENGWLIILILDELERLGQKDLFDIEFFDFLRSLSNDSDGKIAWVTTSYLEVAKVQSNTAKQNTSAFFNLYNQKIYLGSLTTDEARRLVCVPAEAENIHYEMEDVKFLLRLAGHMPFPLQAAAALLFHDYVENRRGREAQQRLRHLFAENMDRYFVHYWDSFETPEKTVLKKIVNEKQPGFSENQYIRNLVNYGFLADPETISSEAFRDWIRASI